MASDPEAETDLEAVIEQVRLATGRLRGEADRLVAVLARLDEDGEGPPEVVVAQREQLLVVERALDDVRRWSQRENQLREAAP